MAEEDIEEMKLDWGIGEGEGLTGEPCQEGLPEEVTSPSCKEDRSWVSHTPGPGSSMSSVRRCEELSAFKKLEKCSWGTESKREVPDGARKAIQ